MITVFTPAYNREKLLPRLYKSLTEQEDANFEWLIVDDGSTDNTKEYVKRLIDENKIKIRYVYQPNGGKYTAFNRGVFTALGELFFCVDSDDFLTRGALKLIEEESAKITDENIGGIIAQKQDLSGKKLGKSFPNGLKFADTYELAAKYNCTGEWSLIYKTEILRKNLFPFISGENFVTESVVYDQIAKKYKMLLKDEVLCICEYQADGLTNGIFNLMLKNPTGYKIYYKQRIDMALTKKERIGYIVRYNAFNTLSGDKAYAYAGRYKALVALLKPLGWLLVEYYKQKKRRK